MQKTPSARGDQPLRRRGRPRSADVGAVDERILDAATEVILEYGYSRATMQQVADQARAGKTTLYARYPTKRDLFAAVVRRSSASFAPARAGAGVVGSFEDRLTGAGIELAETTLTTSSIALMRATLAEAETLPQVAQSGFHIGFDACARSIVHLFESEPGADTEGAPQDAVALTRARRFIELALHPLYMHAFFGADLTELRERAPHCIREVATDFVGRASEPRPLSE